MRIEELFCGLDFQLQCGAAPYRGEIEDVVTSPQAALLHTLYVCLITPLGDGHLAAHAAYANGCRLFLAARGLALPPDAAVYITNTPEQHLGELAARIFGYPARYLTVLGITGTYGKTATAYMLAALLKENGRRTALLTTDGFEVDDRLQPAGPVAPNAADVQRMLRDARAAGAELVILELSAYQLAHFAHKAIPFAAVLLTDLVPHHIGAGMHRDFTAYRAAKERLLASGAPILVLPTLYHGEIAATRVLRYGNEGEVTFTADRACFENGRWGTAFALGIQGESFSVFCPVLGDFAAKNATAAAALALAVGLTPAEIAAAMPSAAPVGRMEPICLAHGALVVRDTAYEGEPLARALICLRRVTKGKLSVLLGSVGGRAEARRAPLGTAAVANADFVYFTADDPDFEDPDRIIDGMVSEVENSTRYARFATRRAAIVRAVADLRPDDTLLILGKARDHTQLMMGIKRRFDDREAVFDAMRQR